MPSASNQPPASNAAPSRTNQVMPGDLPAPRTACAGLFRRKAVWRPTARGWLVLMLLVALLGVGVLLGSYPFLAPHAPIHGGALVVEGWLPDYALEVALAEFKRHPYDKLYVTGGPLERGEFLAEYRSYAGIGAATLRKMGLPETQVQAVPAPFVRQDRTYTSAVTLRAWLKDHGRSYTNLHVISIGPHARRTRLLFEKAMGEGTTIGITAVQDRNYDARRWWAFSPGVRAVVDEWVAYLYARLLFRPKAQVESHDG